MAVYSRTPFHADRWVAIVLLTLALWLGGSFMVDAIMMPSLYASGMMTQPGFASAGYSMFWTLNRVELLAAGVVATGVLLLLRLHWLHGSVGRWAIALAASLITVTLVDTYLFSPALSEMGLDLNLFSDAIRPNGMTLVHQGYFLLEVVKFAAGGVLLSLCYPLHNASDR